MNHNENTKQKKQTPKYSKKRALIDFCIILGACVFFAVLGANADYRKDSENNSSSFKDSIWISPEKNYISSSDSSSDGDYVDCVLMIKTNKDSQGNDVHLTLIEMKAFSKISSYKILKNRNEGHEKKLWIEFDNDKNTRLSWDKNKIDGFSDELLAQLKNSRVITMGGTIQASSRGNTNKVQAKVDIKSMPEALNRFSQCREKLRKHKKTTK